VNAGDLCCSSDVYSFGVLLYEFFIGMLIFAADVPLDDLHHNELKTGIRRHFPESVDITVRDVIHPCYRTIRLHVRVLGTFCLPYGPRPLWTLGRFGHRR
jgi:hypothetical protein